MNGSAADAALAVFAVAPHALGGVRLRSHAGPEREAWLTGLRALLCETMPWRRMPSHIDDEALLGGLDLAGTLAAGRPVAQRGLLAQAEGGIIVAAMAERIGPALASRLTSALDDGCTLALVALDEGADDDEAPPASLLDRLALYVQPTHTPVVPERGAIERARGTWRDVAVDEALIEALVATAAGLGIASARPACHAVTVARVAAAVAGRDVATAEDAALAARLVLAPRATQLPASPADPSPPDSPAQAQTDRTPDEDQHEPDQALDERVIEAALAAIPPGLLALLAAGKACGTRRGDAGRVGQATRSPQRGRPVGAQRGEPRGGARLELIATLRAAAPWQRLRRAAAGDTRRVLVTREDLRIQRRMQRQATTTIFAIDASGSQALHRLAEAKGAVELLLADCYARRDRVAVIGFRGESAQLLLAPTRSLLRAKRQLAGLPGGGGTPLAAGIDAATALAAAVRRGGATPLVVLLTDGRANIARSGRPGRAEATADALAAARAFGTGGTPALLIDTSPQPSPAARNLAQALGARCVALPHAAADRLSAAVRQERGSAGPRHG